MLQAPRRSSQVLRTQCGLQIRSAHGWSGARAAARALHRSKTGKDGPTKAPLLTSDVNAKNGSKAPLLTSEVNAKNESEAPSRTTRAKATLLTNHVEAKDRRKKPTWWTSDAKAKNEAASLERINLQEHKTLNSALLEELFPEETWKPRLAHAAQRKTPRLDVRKLGRYVPSGPTIRRQPVFMGAWRVREAMAAQGEQSTVLVLRHASKNLVLEDFQRLIPRGKHLDSWSPDLGNIVRVVPGRDLTTLERRNYYYIIFTSALSAFAYQGRATRAARVAHHLTARPDSTPVAPPLVHDFEGENPDEVAKSYTLSAPLETLVLRQLKPPLAPVIDELVQHLGYPEIVSRPDRSPAEVLMRFEGWTPMLLSIRSELIFHERKRGLPWTGEMASIRIHKWTLERKNRSTASYASDDESDSEDEDNANQAGEYSQPLNESDLVRWGPEGDFKDETEVPTQSRTRRHVEPSFIVGLQTEAEASAFVKYWHRRPMDVKPPEGMLDGPPIVNAEILW